MDIKAFIAAEVKSGVAVSIKDRDALELESAAKVFEKAYGWLKFLVGAALAMLALAATLMGVKYRDFFSGVDRAKQVVSEEANGAKGGMANASRDAVKGINDASQSARSEIEAEGTSVRKDTQAAQVALQDAQHIKPEFQAMLQQLNQATEAVAKQQKTLSSTENFIKEVFSSRRHQLFSFAKSNTSTMVVIPPDEKLPHGPQRITIVYLLLDHSPIPSTLQAQFNIFVYPQEFSQQLAHNLIGMQFDENFILAGGQVAIDYFPDPSDDKEHIKGLAVRNGRVYADDQPLPKLGAESDPDFKGNKWMKVVDPSGNPVQR